MKCYEALIRVMIDAPDKSHAEWLARYARDKVEQYCQHPQSDPAKIDYAYVVEVRQITSEAQSRIDSALARISEFPDDASWMIGEILRGEQ